ncbi:agmatine deiminase family protein [Caulobacter sp. BP25]|uniref:agmatine deiminase family protein n=1 Tax=Caulobacter sp. BP25 TaxID=2048900 RepID=UPI000C12D1C8|nr:agmatine deiminase family protein [Caulobacter sp. BP25]PHY19030.1 agmatine deiminase [Caulobacter sp. BP25]
MTVIVPAEWAPHRAMWVGFPSHAELWQEDLEQAQQEVADLARALAGPGGERVRLMVVGDEAEAAARALLSDTAVEIVRGQFGDIWLRDTGPIFVDDSGKAVAAGFKFNGWGGKYSLEGDDIVAEQIAAASGTPLARNDFILEGGALDHDGLGTILTTRQCLLNDNRNTGWDEASAAAALAAALGAKKVLWLGDGLLNDHTDGHVDNLARFVAPGVVACPMAYGADDPNTEVYAETARLLAGLTDSRGSPVQVARIPSPGKLLDEDGEPIPASHMNFLIANEAVIVPIYAEESGAFAVEVIKGLFPERQVIGLPSTAILTGGGSFHCISQQEPETA